MAKFDHFNFISPLYDLIFGRRIDQEIVEFADVNDDQSVLDVGGGTGRVGILFRQSVENVIIVDASINMLREAQAKALSSVNSHSEHLPFPKGTFERIIMVDALHHVKHQGKTLQEMWRVLKNNGRLIIEEPDINNLVVKLIAFGEKLLLMRSHFIQPETIAVMCDFNGQSSIEIKRKKGNAWIIVEKKIQETEK